MGTPHVCFADMPQYEILGKCKKSTDVIATTLTTEYDDAAALQRERNFSKECSISPSSISPTPRYERNMGFFQQLSRRFGLRSNDDLVYAANEDDANSSSTDSCSSTTGTMPAMQSSAGNSISSTSSSAAIIRTNMREIHGYSMEHISCASSETSSTIDIEDHHQQQQQQQKHESIAVKERKSVTRSSFSRLQRRSTSSIRRAFESFSLSSRSLSCSGASPTPPNDSTTGKNNIQKSALKSTSNTELNKRASISTTTNNSSTKSSKTKSKPPPQRILRQPVSYTYLKGISGLPTQRVPRSSVCCQYARR
ncbi:uncharacterized protein LOC119663577 [Teleopsis dalmanni]|uniref:uncharacterized protein LOC119663577 n=1 Tax=Teleopsis dalmanni TaxID=139649 RepID=UPI0018CF6E21|nr:uncharacterized protein LOC119663577 [Teleopsis dalmanni]